MDVILQGMFVYGGQDLGQQEGKDALLGVIRGMEMD